MMIESPCLGFLKVVKGAPRIDVGTWTPVPRELDRSQL